MATTRPFIWGVGVDGSPGGWKAVETAFNLMESTRDELQILHVVDRSSMFLERLEDTAKLMCQGAGVTCTFHTKQKEEGDSTKDAVCTLSDDRKVSWLILGSVGRKKADSTDLEVIGSCTDLSVRQASASIVIVKPTSQVPATGSPRRWLLGFDGSPAANRALEFVSQLAKPEDHLAIIIVSDYMSFTSYYEKRLRERLSRDHILGDVIIEGRTLNTIGDQILAFAERKGPFDYIIIGADGMGAFKRKEMVIGSVADLIVKKSPVTTLVVKPDLERKYGIPAPTGKE